jgi:sporulation integral membrane protein YtvI
LFSASFVKSLKSFGLFLLLYTLLFVFIFTTASYTFPFVAAFAIAFLIQPATKFFQQKLKLAKGMPSLLSSSLVYLLFFSLLSLFFYAIVREAQQLLSHLPAVNLDLIMQPLRRLIEQIGGYFNEIDPAFIEKNSAQISRFFSEAFGILEEGLTAFLRMAVSIPAWITGMIVIMLSTYFFSRDMGAIKEKILSIFSDRGREKFVKVCYEGIKMLTRFIKAYSIVYFLTFIQTLIGFSALGIKYAVMLSLVCAVADIFPILGIGLVYIPLSVSYFIAGHYFTAAAVIVLYIIISVVRQIVEPKIVSTSVGIHPVLVLAILFIGLKAYGFIGMLYLTFLVVFYKVLKSANVL